MLKQEAERYPDRLPAVSTLYKLGIQKVPGASAKLIEVARNIPADSLMPSVPQNIAELAQHESQLRGASVAILKDIASHEKTKAGKAAVRALETLERKA